MNKAMEDAIEEAFERGRMLERERCVTLIRIVIKEAAAREVTATEAMLPLLHRIENPIARTQ